MPLARGDHPARLGPASGLIGEIGMKPAHLVRRSPEPIVSPGATGARDCQCFRHASSLGLQRQRCRSSRKLQRHGVKKIVPENKNETFGLFVRNQQVERIIRRELKKLNGDGNAKPPFNLSAQVRRYPVEESIGAVG